MKKFIENPWFSILYNPSKTVSYILNTNPKMGFFFLSSIWFLEFFFIYICFFGFPFHVSFFLVLLLAALLSPFLGALGIFIFSAVLYIFSKMFKGEAKFSHIKTITALSKTPYVFSLILWFSLSFFALDMIIDSNKLLDSKHFIIIISICTTIWSFIILLFSQKQIQKFSVLKSFISISLSYLLILTSLFLILFISIK
ncbi:MAG: hypothetical protein A2888_00545 [Chlamydiae bacterium RIFCSPLOWO2_01_FULL_28_7]|nr:MAG: hypothetical protein A2888_00545 [Chlamydiae bacterium RIFCSPLOWO2_01_FULL_28_7]